MAHSVTLRPDGTTRKPMKLDARASSLGAIFGSTLGALLLGAPFLPSLPALTALSAGVGLAVGIARYLELARSQG